MEFTLWNLAIEVAAGRLDAESGLAALYEDWKRLNWKAKLGQWAGYFRGNHSESDTRNFVSPTYLVPVPLSSQIDLFGSQTTGPWPSTWPGPPTCQRSLRFPSQTSEQHQSSSTPYDGAVPLPALSLSAIPRTPAFDGAHAPLDEAISPITVPSSSSTSSAWSQSSSGVASIASALSAPLSVGQASLSPTLASVISHTPVRPAHSDATPLPPSKEYRQALRKGKYRSEQLRKLYGHIAPSLKFKQPKWSKKSKKANARLQRLGAAGKHYSSPDGHAGDINVDTLELRLKDDSFRSSVDRGIIPKQGLIVSCLCFIKFDLL